MRYRITFYRVPMNLWVELDADDADEAESRGWNMAQEYAQTLQGDGRNVDAELDLDGIGPDEIDELP